MILSSEHLQAVIAEPGMYPNTTSRFDRAGFITSVLLDGQYEFCTAEPENLPHKSSGGHGLCSEFIAPEMCVAAPFDGLFPKPGIGLLRRKGESPYCFYDSYETVPYPIRWSQTESSVVFYTDPLPCCGWAFAETKEIRLEGRRLITRVTLSNLGKKPLDAEEYCHNFITLLRLPLGKGYHIDMPGIRPQKAEVCAGILKGEGTGFTFGEYSPDSMLYNIPKDDILPGNDFRWSLCHDQSPVSVSVTDCFHPHRVSIWAVDHMISVEVFFPVRLMPGEEVVFERRWEFNGS